jgi:CubicO group peptidase (beta-lactamase class C family)
MILVEECQVRLDDPIDRYLPELADRRVLARLDGPLTETVPAHRPITLRDLLTMRMGFGFLMSEHGDWPIEQAMRERGLAVGPAPVAVYADEWLKQLASVPLLKQPGSTWMYDTSFDLLGVLISRVTGLSLGASLRRYVFDPLGMKDTGFSVPPEQIHRLVTAYATDHQTDSRVIWDEAEGGLWSRRPVFESARGGLVSTVDDLLAFSSMMQNQGTFNGQRILSRPSIQAMTTNQVTPEQTADAQFFLGDHRGWGFGMAVTIHRNGVSSVPGQYGWDGGYGTSWMVDPAEQLTGILLTQRMWDSATGPAIYHDFWTLVYQSIDD